MLCTFRTHSCNLAIQPLEDFEPDPWQLSSKTLFPAHLVQAKPKKSIRYVYHCHSWWHRWPGTCHSRSLRYERTESGGTEQRREALNHETVMIYITNAVKDAESSPNAPVVKVDYTDSVSLTATLESYNIGTVISTMQIMLSAEPELNLVRAAEASSCTKRFIPSSWGIPYTQE